MIDPAREAVDFLGRALDALDRAAKSPEYVQVGDLFGCLKYCRELLSERAYAAQEHAAAYWLPPLPPDQTIVSEDEV